MVVRSERSDEEVDRIFRALADATRRDILRRTMSSSTSVTELAAEYDMSFAAVQKHVAVLELAGLISKQARGRQRLVNAEPHQIARARRLLGELEARWRAWFGQLDDVLGLDPSDPNP